MYRYQFGIDYDDYLALLEQQDGACAICRHPETTKHTEKTVKRLAIDHDPATGRVRGLLCKECNVALGCLHDDVERMLLCIEYLVTHRQRTFDLAVGAR